MSNPAGLFAGTGPSSESLLAFPVFQSLGWTPQKRKLWYAQKMGIARPAEEMSGAAEKAGTASIVDVTAISEVTSMLDLTSAA